MKELPVSDVMAHMLRSTFNNLKFALHAQWPWALILAAVIVLPQQLLGIKPVTIDGNTPPDPAQITQVLPWLIVIGLVASLGFASAAVNWHRYILLDEVPKGMQKLRLDGTVWRYFGNLILMCLMLFAVLLPLALVFSIFVNAGLVFVVVVMFLFLVFVVSPLVYRWSVKLPSIAVGRTDFTFGDAWKATDGNWMRFAGVGLLMMMLSWIVGLGLAGVSLAAVTALGDVTGFWVDVALQVAINWVLTIMGVTLLTSLYGFFVEDRSF